MGYAVEGDIRRHLGRYSPGWPPAGGNPPTLADGIEFADQASGQLDAILSGRGITVPVAAPPSFVEHMRDLAAIYAAALISAALFPQAQGPSSTTHHEFLLGIWKDGLAALREGDGIPDDVARAGTSLPTSVWTTHAGSKGKDLDDGADGNTTDPVFRRDTQW